MNYRPHMLVKVRSDPLMNAIGGKVAGKPIEQPMPCTIRISGLIPGHRCASRETVVGCHLGELGKGMSTKVSDIQVAAGCMNCHMLVDGVDPRWFWLLENHPVTTLKRILTATHETQAMLVELGIISVKGQTLI